MLQAYEGYLQPKRSGKRCDSKECADKIGVESLVPKWSQEFHALMLQAFTGMYLGRFFLL